MLRYDALVLAVGARHRTASPRAITFTGDRSTLAYNGLLADLEEHWTSSVAFVVPSGTTWPLPLYELALMTARDVQSIGIDDTRLHLITPEATPLASFGPHASQAVATMLDRAGVRFAGDTHAQQTADGRFALLPSDEMLDAERAGGIHTRSSSVCVPLTFRIGARAQTVRFGIGRHCSAGGRPGGAPGGPASRSG